ncbi:MAG: hypothetical protein Q8L01_00660 [Candidatus Woesebacteria bacterium]|nr:hypothetical protein [Candidatus Woesebacteria bacterium]
MDKRIAGVVFLAGVLVLAGVGCGDKSSTAVQKSATADSADRCGPTKEVAAPDALTGELKSILNEACGEVKLIANVEDNSAAATDLVFVWRKKPTAEKLESAFKKRGYEMEIAGETLVATKGEVTLNISWTGETDCRKIGVRITNKPVVKSKGRVTTAECAEMMVYARNADVRTHNVFIAMPWSIKLFDRAAELEKKYGMTQDELSKACNAKVNDPEFNKEVERQTRELQNSGMNGTEE